MYAASRHAANLLLRRGHRRLAIVIENMDWAGFRRTERGFTDAIRDEGGHASVQVLKHAGTPAALRQLVTRTLADVRRPSALFIVNPFHYIGVATLLAEMGVSVPRDISLVCRDDDTAFRFMSVEPTRYSARPEALAKELFSLLKRTIEGGVTDELPSPVLILPELVPGASVAASRAGL
jgi:LacI family transcriptional regulator